MCKHSLDNVRRCIGEKETYGEACVRVIRCPWVGHGLGRLSIICIRVGRVIQVHM